jgi:hypothetical protein
LVRAGHSFRPRVVSGFTGRRDAIRCTDAPGIGTRLDYPHPVDRRTTRTAPLPDVAKQLVRASIQTLRAREGGRNGTWLRRTSVRRRDSHELAPKRGEIGVDSCGIILLTAIAALPGPNLSGRIEVVAMNIPRTSSWDDST